LAGVPAGAAAAAAEEEEEEEEEEAEAEAAAGCSAGRPPPKKKSSLSAPLSVRTCELSRRGVARDSSRLRSRGAGGEEGGRRGRSAGSGGARSAAGGKEDEEDAPAKEEEEEEEDEDEDDEDDEDDAAKAGAGAGAGAGSSVCVRNVRDWFAELRARWNMSVTASTTCSSYWKRTSRLVGCTFTSSCEGGKVTARYTNGCAFLGSTCA
jgi:hypothetical protein